MKPIGLIGGMSFQSSAEYCRIINQETNARLGRTHFAKSLMVTVDFAEIKKLQHKGNWDALGAIMADAARSLEKGGAEFIVLCTNTMHKLSAHIEKRFYPTLTIGRPHSTKNKITKHQPCCPAWHCFYNGTRFL